MELKLDTGVTYAVALSGGGAKGGYEVGVWRALEEAGIKYDAVSGTSVGALNGAFMTMRDLDTAESVWRNIRYSDVMDVDDDNMGKLFDKNVRGIDIGGMFKKAYATVRDGGFDITPLRNMLHKYIDTKRIKSSDVEFFIVTYSISDRRELPIAVKSLPDDDICDMLLASAYFPAFKNEPLTGGRRFTDGGLTDVLPITPLIQHGRRNIIAVRLRDGLGHEKRIRPTDAVKITYIEPKRKLGNTLNFSSEQARFNMELGYYDAKRVLYGLGGDYYYYERTINEQQALDELISIVRAAYPKQPEDLSLRRIHEVCIPRIAHEAGAEGDYCDVLMRWAELEAQRQGIPEFRIMKDTELVELVKAGLNGDSSKTLAKAVRR